MSKWFTADKLAHNLEKTNIIKYIMNNSPQYEFSIGYNKEYLEELVYTKCIGYKL